jgi:hypothetical protein
MILILAKEERVEEVLKARREEGGGRRRSENIFVFFVEFDVGSEMGELDDLLGELDALRGGELGSWWLSRLRNMRADAKFRLRTPEVT